MLPVTKQPTLAELTGGLGPAELLQELDRGARFIYFRYTVSALFLTITRNSKIQFLKPGESAVRRSLPYTALTLCLGWWGFPFGLIYTPVTLYRNLAGETDITASVRSRLETDQILSFHS